MCLLLNSEVPSCNHCCSGKAINIAYSECVSAALGIRHVMRMHHVAICGLCGCTSFFPTFLTNDTIFGEIKT